MIVSLTIVRYKTFLIPLAFMAMAVHRLPLWLTKSCSFWKLVGNGKNGTFDIQPDFNQWGLLAVWNEREDFDKFNEHSFISKWWNLFVHEKWTILCEPLISHGKWDGKEPFKNSLIDKNFNGRVAVLTRAKIRFSKLRAFWSNVDNVSKITPSSTGYITSFGIGEAPLFLQGTFSVWESQDAVKAYAYQSKEHSEVIRKTREGNWYSEELFARFKVIESFGTLNGINPIER